MRAAFKSRGGSVGGPRRGRDPGAHNLLYDYRFLHFLKHCQNHKNYNYYYYYYYYCYYYYYYYYYYYFYHPDHDLS